MKAYANAAAIGLAMLVSACGAQNNRPIAAAQPPEPVAPAKNESLTIAFPTSGSGLSTEAQAQLDGAARLYRDARPSVMIVSGHTDKTGAEFPNLVLSARRANMVKRALVDRGVPAERLQIIAVGAAEPLPTVTAARSVVVTWR